MNITKPERFFYNHILDIIGIFYDGFFDDIGIVDSVGVNDLEDGLELKDNLLNQGNSRIPVLSDKSYRKKKYEMPYLLH